MLRGNQNQIFYVITVNGAIVSAQFTERSVAEAQKALLPPETQSIAVIETVTTEGKQVLLG